MSDELRSCDYLVIGAGSAGCIVAARLAEAGHKTILVEAGPRDHNPMIHVPAGVRYLLRNPAVAWQDVTAASPGAGGRSIAMPHGRVLGGSGSINGMLFVRGLRQDFDGWAKLGCTGWGYDDVLPFFKSLETYRGTAGAHRGTSGPLAVEDQRLTLPLTRAFVAAAGEAGHPILKDINQPDNEGAGYSQMNRNGRFRASSARAFLGRAKRTGNLVVWTDAVAERLNVTDGRCHGAVVVRGNKRIALEAVREVVICCGAIGTPQLLQLSGIGDGAHLTGLDIPVALHRPAVGDRLTDHFGPRIAFEVQGIATMNERSHLPRLALEVANWMTLGRGMLTTGVTAAMVFCRSRPDLSAPDLQLLFTPMSFDADRFGMLERRPGCSITVSACQPKSVGRVTIQSPDPGTRPTIAMNYLSDPEDVQAIVSGIGHARRIMSQPSISRHIMRETLPGAASVENDLADFVRASSATVYHPAGSCRMGADGDAVVDPQLRVRGVAGLRIADASIMPRITSGNTNAPTMMIGEKAAAMILADAVG